MDKEQLRKQLRRRLIAMEPAVRKQKSSRACRNLFSTKQFQQSGTVMMYLSLAHEVDTCEAILYSWQLGKTVAVPKISWQQRHMIPVEINTLETDFSEEIAGLKNPVGGMPTPISRIDMVITPGLGFDRKGNRLGRGGAYYDKFFSNVGLKAARCGLAFAEQIVDSVPVLEHDKPIDFLVTDKEVIYFNEDNDKTNLNSQ